LAVNLEKTLRKKFGKRSIVVRKGDKVKVVRGQWKKKQGKILRVDSKRERVYIEGITRKKMDGSNAEVPIRFSNLQITELNLDDKKRIKNQPKQEVKNGDKNAP
jgi:large subunit ribosomal protein L24